MPVKTESNTLSDGLKWEQDANYSRAKVTIAYHAKAPLLAVLGQVTTSGKYKPLNPAGDDGTEKAAGISLLAVDASGGDCAGVILNDDALVNMDALVWPDAITVEQKAAAIVELSALGIKAVSVA
ncbi:head decoration protein [Desulfotalea psychrophila]|uniref:Head decoration protein n=1 Tax=Desulfotalea psychrophila (strain LSv54 / DSM 12343) TaxID=177439 RepID=Q6AMW1_DESPS|nr:head decoration protein [Desulfotalea psychrophila]CAG36313.1 hypothetical protein DP1584 [Desulfotalea psychrophila LSv54]